MPLDDDLRRLAARQHAVLSRRQARELGASTPALRHRLTGPDWELASPRVLRLVGSPPGLRQRLMVAVLDAGPGAVVSHRSAAVLWRLPGFHVGDVEVSITRGRSGATPGTGILHRPRALPAWHVTERHGIPVTSLARTLFDVAGTVHRARLERLVDTVVARSPSTLATLHRMPAELGRPGRDGASAMRAVLQARPEGYVVAASGLEARFARILGDAGEEALDRQVDVGGHDWLGRVDFLDQSLGVVVEVDSDLHHTSPSDRANDQRRDESLRRAGWREIVRVTEDEIWRRPDVALAKVRSARRRARLALALGIDTMVSIPGARRREGQAGWG